MNSFQRYISRLYQIFLFGDTTFTHIYYSPELQDPTSQRGFVNLGVEFGTKWFKVGVTGSLVAPVISDFVLIESGSTVTF